MRHATRYGLPPLRAAVGNTEQDQKQGQSWVLAGAPEGRLDRGLGARWARAASLFRLALPGSAYTYQGEELGLHEVGDIADEDRQDPWLETGSESVLAFRRPNGWVTVIPRRYPLWIGYQAQARRQAVFSRSSGSVRTVPP